MDFKKHYFSFFLEDNGALYTQMGAHYPETSIIYHSSGEGFDEPELEKNQACNYLTPPKINQDLKKLSQSKYIRDLFALSVAIQDSNYVYIIYPVREGTTKIVLKIEPLQVDVVKQVWRDSYSFLNNELMVEGIETRIVCCFEENGKQKTFGWNIYIPFEGYRTGGESYPHYEMRKKMKGDLR